MKKAIIIAFAALALTSCTKRQKYTCQCYGGFTGGPTEQVEITSTSRDNAQLQCSSLADPPTNARNSCSLL